MRMWYGVEPFELCDRHLLGEHVEMHMLAGTLLRGRSIRGYVERGLVVPGLIRRRHDDLAKEIVRRGMRHCSPLPKGFRVPRAGDGGRLPDAREHRAELHRRCAKCRERVHG
jgi:hypothetical protein